MKNSWLFSTLCRGCAYEELKIQIFSSTSFFWSCRWNRPSIRGFFSFFFKIYTQMQIVKKRYHIFLNTSPYQWKPANNPCLLTIPDSRNNLVFYSLGKSEKRHIFFNLPNICIFTIGTENLFRNFDISLSRRFTFRNGYRLFALKNYTDQ